MYISIFLLTENSWEYWRPLAHLSLAITTEPKTKEALHKCLLNDLFIMCDMANKTKMPFVHITVYIFCLSYPASFWTEFIYLFIVHHFFRFGQSFHSDKMVFFYLPFKFLCLLPKACAAPSNFSSSSIYYYAINFFLQVVNNNSEHRLLYDIILSILGL